MYRKLATLLALMIVMPPLTAAGPEGQSAGVSNLRAEKPLIGPPAPWVLPAPIPAAPAAAEGAATAVLLADTQARFTALSDAFYSNSVFRIATPQGLDDAALQISWDPDLESVTLHRYRLLRDGKPINLLGDGSKLIVVRRESNLERATLDGELTATLQPEDLRVGDIVDIAYTITRRDPAMGGHSEILAGPNDGTPYGRHRIRILWPSTKKMRWRALPGIIQPKLGRAGSDSELLSDVVNATPLRPPEGAPARFTAVNAVEITEFSDWASVSRAYAPLYDKASTLSASSPLHAEVARIAAVSQDPKIRAALALKLVQDQVRYVFLGMDDGGYVPAPADQTWLRRFGDCKGKTVLLVALLRALDIDARAALVNTEHGDYLTVRLPGMRVFDHAIVEAQIGGRSYWLDGTRLGDRSLDHLETPAYHVALPVSEAGADLVRLIPEPLDRPNELVSLTLDASGGVDVPAPAKAEMRFRGEVAAGMRMDYADMSPADRDKALRKKWRETYDFITPSSVTMQDDPATGEFALLMTGTAKMDWSAEAGTRWYEADRARVGWKIDTTREGGVNRDAPFAFDYPDWWASHETIILPNGGADFRLQGGDVDKSVAGLYRFYRKVEIDKGVMTLDVDTRALSAELPFARAEEARTQMAELAQTGIYIRLPNNYRATDGDIAALKNDRPAQAQAYMKRGAFAIDDGRIDAALADEDAALAIDPKLAVAHSMRALALALKSDARADAAADQAVALDHDQYVAWVAKAQLAQRMGRYADADGDYARAIALDGKNERFFLGRAAARLGMGHFADALADIDKALAISPQVPTGHAVRAASLAGLGRQEEAVKEADLALAEQSDQADVRLLRAELHAALGQADAARSDLDILIAARPTSALYLRRAALWPQAERNRRLADIDAAARLDPKSAMPLVVRAEDAINRGDFARAESDLAAAENLSPGMMALPAMRARILVARGHSADALTVMNRLAVKSRGDAAGLNESCWTKATLKLDLDSALIDCEAALKLNPANPAYLDSRAFVKLRLGRLDAAIADYDDALAHYPKLPASLFGRGIARLRKGDNGLGKADIAAATQIDPAIVERFAGYGLSPDAPANDVAPSASSMDAVPQNRRDTPK